MPPHPQPRHAATRVGGLSVWLLACSAALLLVWGPHGGDAAPTTCPKPDEISPCSCILKKNGLDVLCEFTDLQTITKVMGVLKSRNVVIFYLKLRHNNLPRMQGYAFLGLDIRHLTIHNSSLAVIEDISLSSQGKALTQLDLSQNALTQVPSAAIKNLHALLILNLNHNKVGNLHSKAFEGLDTLEILTLYENKIGSIDADAFKGLEKKLKRLNLGGNDLMAVPTAALSSMDMLKKLEIQENQISEIREGDFDGMHSLDSLVLAHNHLHRIPARAFSSLGDLNSLEIEGNQITDLDPEAFAGLEGNLQYLRLGDNKLNQIPSSALVRLHRLRHLDLRSNNISVIQEDAFAGFGDTITFLNLQKNDIKVLPALVFENLNSIDTLSLHLNKLTHIPEEVMEYIVDTLRVIDITDNPLVCDCELRWYKEWLKRLKNKEDELMIKKKAMCTMAREHHEYNLRDLPLDKMNCKGKYMQQSTSGASTNGVVPTTGVATALATLACWRLCPRNNFQYLKLAP